MYVYSGLINYVIVRMRHQLLWQLQTIGVFVSLCAKISEKSEVRINFKSTSDNTQLRLNENRITVTALYSLLSVVLAT